MFRIAQIDILPIAVPLKKPVIMAAASVHEAENLVVRIADRDGTVGWGEAASAPMMNGETLAGMVAAAAHMAGRLTDAEIPDLAAIAALVDAAIVGNPGAKSAVEMALLDILGQRTDQPLHVLLNRAERPRAPVLSFISGGTEAEELAHARAMVDTGHVALKVKIGLLGVERDLARCAAVRAEVGPDIRLSADANGGYSRADALAFVARAAETGLDFVEQPVAPGDMDGMRACAEASGVPIAADEGLKSIDSIRRHHELGAAAGGSIKTIKLGGCLPVMEAGRLMQNLGMQVNLAGKTAETSIASAAIAHLAIALPQVNWDVSVTSTYLATDVVHDPIAPRDGHVTAPERPGLGIEVDEALLSKLRV
ncbi:mandelate racemase/muconate lactonizing enzyme family protein [Histidinibacterium lentulum]|uniref:Mandelate racemase/muconate lactonizing enzyme C-terminal domain-containing protein n=1 Tax=Histidinibacterium lentulum TaxID=2480588 RepID=A0A3N2QRH1_9RHOB|nr:mandelate racemase/muconate lactonizing enzyme family protein [Histidinibacterium lentulum]ROT97807.1 hypothetical protein EAT49_18580 [Histidinibacterium lentulum]